MNDTPNLALPYILAAQAQKHVTHNEAIRALDCLVQLSVESRALSAPPPSPAEGARYIVAASPTGAWSGNAGKIAALQDGAWAFYAPKEGWAAWVAAESALVIHAAGAWSLYAGLGGGGGLSAPVGNASLANMANGTIKGRTSSGSGAPEDLTGAQATALLDAFTGSGASHKKGLVPAPGSTAGTARYLREDGSWADLSNVPLAGVNTTADATNKFAVKSAATLFDNAGNGHQQKINKAAAGDTASQLYQTNYSGRAEIGLTGDDDFHFKVSPDGSSWKEAIKIDRSTGKVSFPQSGGPREVLTANRTYYVRPDGTDTNSGLANSSGGAFLTLQKAWNNLRALDLNGFVVTIQIADGTYTAGLSTGTPGVGIGNGNVVFLGNVTTPSNVLISASGPCFSVRAGADISLAGLKMTSSGSACVEASINCVVRVTAPIEFGSAAASHILLQNNAVFNVGANYTISGGAQAHVTLDTGGKYTASGRALTITEAPAFSSAFISALRTGVAVAAGMTFTGSATGARYSVSSNAVIDTGGGGANYLPGNSAGSSATGGQYI
ncbi:DUF2793 domain-containing protein [Hyphomicrobium sp.]|uniref:DUF2793 domain-containing protein n=1 Tax=Hyphomicrobium sp. TaxID=82 RepID=UPI002D79E06F|nr:DUF2793 domain-containing protein [Hyphomicrobium sp.]HET6391010.1 DUF2793 domain-containing protein [Hyphomicrobium sp.]